MMKSIYKYSAIWSLAIALVFAATACKEESTVDENAVQELRFFDLYMSSTFKDTIDAPTESGLYFIEVTEGEGDSPDSDDWVLVNYVCTTIPDETVVDTYIENVATDNGIYSEDAMYGDFKMLNGTRTKGLTEGLSMMKTGGEAIMCMTSDLGYGTGGANLMKSISGYKSLKYELRLIEVIDDMVAYEANKIETYANSIEGAEMIRDTLTDAVMYYVVDEHTDGSQVNNDSVVEIAYKGYLIDGRVFDESVEDAPYEFKVGDFTAETSPIRGWHLGMKEFREGEKGRLIIPYSLAYGEMGRLNGAIYAIQPYETLVFDIEIVKVKTYIDPEEPI